MCGARREDHRDSPSRHLAVSDWASLKMCCMPVGAPCHTRRLPARSSDNGSTDLPPHLPQRRPSSPGPRRRSWPARPPHRSAPSSALPTPRSPLPTSRKHENLVLGLRAAHNPPTQPHPTKRGSLLAPSRVRGRANHTGEPTQPANSATRRPRPRPQTRVTATATLITHRDAIASAAPVTEFSATAGASGRPTPGLALGPGTTKEERRAEDVRGCRTLVSTEG